MSLSQLYEVLYKLVEMRQDATGKERDEINAKINQVKAMIDRAS